MHRAKLEKIFSLALLIRVFVTEGRDLYMSTRQVDRGIITSKQLLFILTGSMIGTDILSLPRVATVSSGQDSWMAVGIGSLAAILVIFLSERVCRLYPNRTLADIAKISLGRIAGTFSAVLFVGYMMFFTIVMIRIFSEISKAYLLPHTPIQYISFTAMVAVAYVVVNGLKTLARLNEILFYILFLIVLVILLPIIQLSDYTNILPVGGSGIISILKDSPNTAFSYLGPEIILIIYTFVGKKDEVLKAGAISVGLVVFIYMMLTVACILTLGSEIMQNNIFPPITLLKAAKFPVIERLDLFFLALWMPLTIRPAINHTFGACYTIAILLGLNFEKYVKHILFPYCIVIFIGTTMFKNLTQAFEFATYIGYLFLIFGIVYPLILLSGIYLFKRR